jgi:cbb3-type cytochrome oxidase maturation protein
MEVLYLLIPLAVVIAGVIVWAFLWAVKSGQFDDLEGPAHRILMDEDERESQPNNSDGPGHTGADKHKP